MYYILFQLKKSFSSFIFVLIFVSYSILSANSLSFTHIHVIPNLYDTVSTPDTSGTTWQNTIEPILRSTLDAARQIPDRKLLLRFMTYWHKFQMIFNGRFVASSVDRL